MPQTRIAIIRLKPKGKKQSEPMQFMDVEGVVVPGEHFITIHTKQGVIAIRQEQVESVVEADAMLQDAPAPLVGADGVPLPPSQPEPSSATVVEDATVA